MATSVAEVVSRAWKAALVVAMAGVMCLFGAESVRAEPNPDLVAVGPRGLLSDVTISGIGVGGYSVAAYDAPGNDPLAGYPVALPSGATSHQIAFAGIINITDTVTGQTGQAYCIDLNTETGVGVNYKLGDWSEANVPNLGYVGYILHNYYPVTTAPSGTNAFKAAAVQLAIWFLTDNLVLAPSSTYFAAVSAIVNDTLANGPSTEPSNPELSVTPETMRAPSTGDIVGPFDVDGDGPGVLRSVGVEVFTGPDGGTPLADGTEVDPGTQLWVRSVSTTDPQGFVLERTIEAKTSTVYLYDGSNLGMDSAQKLILAQGQTFTERAGATIERYAAGDLRLTKTIDGDGAGWQGKASFDVVCTDPDGETQTHTITIDAKSPAGEQVKEIKGLAADSECTITETSDGDNDYVNVTTTVTPATVTVTENDTTEIAATNTYTRGRGSFQLNKTVTGPAAGHQDKIEVTVTCSDPTGDVTHTYSLDAGTTAGTYPQQEITDIPAGAVCNVDETATGANDDVEVSTHAEPATATVLDGTTVTIDLTNTYTAREHLAVTGTGGLGITLLTGLAALLIGAVLHAAPVLARRQT